MARSKGLSKEDLIKRIKSYLKKKGYSMPYSVQEEIAERVIKENLTDKLEMIIDRAFQQYNENMCISSASLKAAFFSLEYLIQQNQQ